jgi:hypothetical protein
MLPRGERTVKSPYAKGVESRRRSKFVRPKGAGFSVLRYFGRKSERLKVRSNGIGRFLWTFAFSTFDLRKFFSYA